MSFIQDIQQADDDAVLAAEAFAFGRGPRYMAARAYDVEQRIQQRYPGSPTIDPPVPDVPVADPGRPDGGSVSAIYFATCGRT